MFRNNTLDDDQIVCVYNAASVLDAGVVRELLEKEGIAVMVMDHEDSGGYLRILGYGTPFGMDVYVNRVDADMARKLIEETIGSASGLTDEELEQAALEAGSPDSEEE